METAKYKKNNNDIQTVEAKNVNNSLYEKNYKGNLYCEEEGCNAEVIFYEKQKGGFKRIFKTKSGSNHVNGCRHEIVRNKTRGKTVRLHGENVNVSSKHINDAINEAYKSFYKKVHNIEDMVKDKSNKSSKKKSESSKIDNKKSANYVVNSSPTTNGEGVLVEGKKNHIFIKEK